MYDASLLAEVPHDRAHLEIWNMSTPFYISMYISIDVHSLFLSYTHTRTCTHHDVNKIIDKYLDICSGMACHPPQQRVRQSMHLEAR